RGARDPWPRGLALDRHRRPQLPAAEEADRSQHRGRVGPRHARSRRLGASPLTGRAVASPPMSRIVVRGGGPLEGRVAIAGATKNEGTKLMAAALLAPGRTVITNIPRVGDLDVMI